MRVDLDELARLEEERAFLLRSLDDLEREHAAGDLDDADYTELRDGYTARTAEVLRTLEAGRAALPPPKPRRWIRIAAIAAALVVVAGLAGVIVAASAGRRLPGEALTGDTAETVNVNLARGRSLFSQGELLDAVQAFDTALAIQPDNAEALTYRGWLLYLVGVNGGQTELVARGEASIDQAIAVAPEYGDAQCFKAVIRFRGFDDAAGAREPLARCQASDPPPEVRALVDALASAIGTG